MASNQFLEEYPLYKKYIGVGSTSSSSAVQVLTKPVHMYCGSCQSDKTFINDQIDVQPISLSRSKFISTDKGTSPVHLQDFIALVFRCASCNVFVHTFYVFCDFESEFLQKVGQSPRQDISIDATTKMALGDDVSLFKKGLICESHSYGIGAYAYYRRIVETKIDGLLDEIRQFLSGSNRTEYETALIRIRNETIAARKIELAKELLPEPLRPNGLNPLDALYVALSEGIHQLSDEECLELASAIRTSLVYLLKRTAESRLESQDYIASVQKILERRKSKG